MTKAVIALKRIMIWILVFLLTGCAQKINTNEEQTPEEVQLLAVITSIERNTAEVKTLDDDAVIRIADFTDYIMDGPEYEVGDTVEIVYDGIMQETYPLTLGSIYQIGLVKKANAEKLNGRAVMVDGTLYFETGQVSNEPRCGMMDGMITSSCPIEMLPTQDNESNFGSDYGYQFGIDTIEVLIDGQWVIFAKEICSE